MILPLIATASLSLAQTVAAEETYHTVQAGETLYSISKRYDISVENLKNWNQLQSNNLNVNQVLLVAQDTEQVDSSTDQEENLTTTEEESPSLEISSENTPESVSNPNSQNTYTVKAGESVYIIAYKFNITADQLKAANGLKSDLIHPNQVLIIPSANHEKPAEPKPNPQPDKNTYTVKAGESLYIIANKFGVTVKELKAANGLKSDLIHPNQVLIIPSASANRDADSTPSQSNDTNTYIVKAGESLNLIAIKFKTSVSELKRVNQLSSDLIHPNQVLIIPTSQDQDTDKEKPKTQIEKNVYRTLDLAIKAAKDHFNYKIHSQWYVDWTANGYKVRYDYK